MATLRPGRHRGRAQAIALERLKAKLVVLAEERQLAEVAELRGDAVKAEWGQQVNPRPKMTLE